MSSTVWFGLLLTPVAGVLCGNCMLPMKFAKRWPFENLWLIFSIVSLLLLPWALEIVFVRKPAGVYAALPASAFALPLLLGAGWGIAQVLFGISVARLGLALGYAIIVGMSAVLGTLLPLFVKNREIVGTGRGGLILAGVAIMVLGIALSGWAGHRRERGGAASRATGGYARALGLAVLCGLMAPMLNYAFAFGQPIADEAVRQGTSPVDAVYAVWPVAMVGGLVPNLAYCFYLLGRNGTWKRFPGGWHPDAWLGALMGALWLGAFATYGVSSVYLGALGTSVGYALFQIFMIMTANLSGVLTGEWKDAPRCAKWGLGMALSLLALATALIASGNN